MQPLLNCEVNPREDRISKDEAYLRMAEIWAERSKATKKQVGAILVHTDQIISDGYNGMPAGDTDEACETWSNELQKLVTKPECLHAESNAYAKLARHGGRAAEGSTLYVTLAPCLPCAKQALQSGTKRVVYRHINKDEGLDFLKVRGIEVVHIPKA